MNNSILAFGPPPLTVEAADCSIDLIDFVAAVVRGVDLIDVTPAVREAWRYHLAAHYQMISPAERNWFANAPAMLEIRRRWPQMQVSEQAAIRQMWAPTLPNLLNWINPALQVAAPVQAVDTSQFAYQRDRGYSSPQESSTGSLLHEILERQRIAEADAAKTSPELALQVKMGHQAQISQMLSNISQMQFQTAMNTVKNMKY